MVENSLAVFPASGSAFQLFKLNWIERSFACSKPISGPSGVVAPPGCTHKNKCGNIWTATHILCIKPINCQHAGNQILINDLLYYCGLNACKRQLLIWLRLSLTVISQLTDSYSLFNTRELCAIDCIFLWFINQLINNCLTNILNTF